MRLAGALLLSAQIALAVGAASPTLSQRTDAERAEQAKRDAEKAKAVAAVEKAAAALKAAYVALGKAVISSDANAISKASDAVESARIVLYPALSDESRVGDVYAEDRAKQLAKQGLPSEDAVERGFQFDDKTPHDKQLGDAYHASVQARADLAVVQIGAHTDAQLESAQEAVGIAAERLNELVEHVANDDPSVLGALKDAAMSGALEPQRDPKYQKLKAKERARILAELGEKEKARDQAPPADSPPPESPPKDSKAGDTGSVLSGDVLTGLGVRLPSAQGPNRRSEDEDSGSSSDASSTSSGGKK